METLMMAARAEGAALAYALVERVLTTRRQAPALSEHSASMNRSIGLTDHVRPGDRHVGLDSQPAASITYALQTSKNKDQILMSDEINHGRRAFLGSAAMAIAAAQILLGDRPVAAIQPQNNEESRYRLPSTKPPLPRAVHCFSRPLPCHRKKYFHEQIQLTRASIGEDLSAASAPR
jgi:hypothetical protein